MPNIRHETKDFMKRKSVQLQCRADVVSSRRRRDLVVLPGHGEKRDSSPRLGMTCPRAGAPRNFDPVVSANRHNFVDFPQPTPGFEISKLPDNVTWM